MARRLLRQASRTGSLRHGRRADESRYKRNSSMDVPQGGKPLCGKGGAPFQKPRADFFRDFRKCLLPEHASADLPESSDF